MKAYQDARVLGMSAFGCLWFQTDLTVPAANKLLRPAFVAMAARCYSDFSPAQVSLKALRVGGPSCRVEGQARGRSCKLHCAGKPSVHEDPHYQICGSLQEMRV